MIPTLPHTLARAAALALALALASPPPALAEDPPLPDLDRVLDHLDDMYRSDSSHGTFTMKVKTRNYERSLTMEAWTIGKDEALIVIRKPARESGTATLRTDDGLWNYAPRADRLIRIPSGLLSESWMGSHFTNDDLMREYSYRDDYDASLAWVDDGGSRVLRVRMNPKKDAAVVYTRVDFFVTAEGWLPLHADYFDRDDLVRRMTYGDVGDLGGRRVPRFMEMVPTDKPDEFTRITYDAMTFNLRIDKDLFTPRGVRKVAQQR